MDINFKTSGLITLSRFPHLHYYIIFHFHHPSSKLSWRISREISVSSQQKNVIRLSCCYNSEQSLAYFTAIPLHFLASKDMNPPGIDPPTFKLRNSQKLARQILSPEVRYAVTLSSNRHELDPGTVVAKSASSPQSCMFRGHFHHCKRGFMGQRNNEMPPKKITDARKSC